MYSRQVLQNILKEVRQHKLSSEKAFSKLKNLPYEVFDFARVDHHRPFRKGFPECIYTPGKSLEQITKIASSIHRSGQPLLLTRVEPLVYRKLKNRFPWLSYSREGQIAYSGKRAAVFKSQTYVVLTAGTSDIPVAEEAAITLEIMGRNVERVYDCGVAAIHRLFDNLRNLGRARAVICVAGMEGALPGVVAGLIDKPVIAVPTSVGYGASFRGMAALLTMMNACSQGMAVVNIDNGFGAACFASMI